MKAQRLHPELLANVLLFFTLFFLSLWRFGANQCLALVVLLVLFFRPWRQQLFRSQHFKSPIIVCALLFFAWTIISLSYSATPSFSKAAQGLTMYSKLLFLLVLPLALHGLKYRRWLEQGLIWGILINAILSTLYYFKVNFIVEHLGRYFSINQTFSINPLQMIFIVVLACWILLQRILNREAHLPDMIIFIFLTIYLWFINIERSGYLLYLVLIFVALYQVMHKKGFFLGLILVPILILGLYEFSPNVKTRVDVGIINLQTVAPIQNFKEVSNDNSLGLRLAFVTETVVILKQHPLLGTGIGSFKYVNANMHGPMVNGSYPNDTHNAYTMVAFELGLIGLILYLAWLASIFHIIKKLPKVAGNLLRGVWWAFVVMGFTDSGLILNAVGLSFIIFVSLYAREQLC